MCHRRQHINISKCRIHEKASYFYLLSHAKGRSTFIGKDTNHALLIYTWIHGQILVYDNIMKCHDSCVYKIPLIVNSLASKHLANKSAAVDKFLMTESRLTLWNSVCIWPYFLSPLSSNWYITIFLQNGYINLSPTEKTSQCKALKFLNKQPGLNVKMTFLIWELFWKFNTTHIKSLLSAAKQFRASSVIPVWDLKCTQEAGFNFSLNSRSYPLSFLTE